MKVGVVDLDSMGMGSAVSLARAGHQVAGREVRSSGIELQAIAGEVWRLSDQPGIGSTVKMANQVRALTFPLPMASAAHQLFLAAAAGGHGARDDAFVIRVWQALAGINLLERPAPETPNA